MLNFKHLFLSVEDDLKINHIFHLLRERYKDYQDPWGLNLELCEEALRKVVPIYRSYFKVRVFGAENIKDQAYIVASNHTGQLPIDAVMITVAFLMDLEKPRILRVMIERFMAQLPFIGDWSAQMGAILGDRNNCSYLIDNGESILVFPEGVPGISKNTADFYKLRPFTDGFYRIALQKRTPILPVCVVGAEEMYPFVIHSSKIAQMLNFPAMPLMTNYMPLPSPIDIYIGQEIPVPEHLSMEASEKEIKENVYHIENSIKRLVVTGLKNRRPFFDKIRKPISNFIIKEFKSKRQHE